VSEPARPRGLRFLLALAGGGLFVLAVLSAIGVVTVRLSRASFDPPVAVGEGVLGVRTAGGIWLYAARGGEGVLLFDAGADPGGKPVDALLRALGAGREDVTDVFVTHGHADHVGALAGLPQARVHAGAGDVGLIEGRERAGWLGWVAQLVAPIPAARVTHPVGADGVIPVPGGGAVRTWAAAGHTRGSCAYLYRGVLVAGDLLDLDDGRLGPGLSVFHESPAEARDAAVRLARALAPDPPRLVCTGHGGCTPPGAAPRMLAALAGP
jgi:glyoxylase-like metal-dependent hydrolase (beta-lactamase superfamily II)